ncbi:putative pre-mRNA-splicing factor ATP-dependent RNA helicase [Morella rubra]|uniref:Putative pre-mRNA-splicing factor ATP-dependent RNA helicase n=1 Tax=Morella rubra TaxID=262757 RepID=A0A6A1VGU6_9ROSI|nr:putative pre-mRNA-splicing factor ATP-dependent RNA helicase [Morella rubra]
MEPAILSVEACCTENFSLSPCRVRYHCNLLHFQGRGFHVQIRFLKEPVQDYVQAAVSTVLSIHDQEPMGDVLVFLTGQDDIDAAIQLLNEQAHSNRTSAMFVASIV